MISVGDPMETCNWRVYHTRGGLSNTYTSCGSILVDGNAEDFAFCPRCGRAVNIRKAQTREAQKSYVIPKGQLAQNFGNFIRNVREQKQMSKSQLGTTLGVSVTSIMNYERGRSLPSVPELFQISDTLGVSVYDMFMITPPAGDVNADE